MKKVVLSIVIILMIVSCKKENGRVQVEYFDNGQIKMEFVYKDGKQILLREYTYYDNGQTKTEGIYKEGNLFIVIKYNDKGIIKDEAYFNNNKLTGYAYLFHDNGCIYQLAEYKNAQREGLGYLFIKNPTDDEIGGAVMYKNGQIVSERSIVLKNFDKEKSIK